MKEQLRVQRLGALVRTGVHQVPPLADLALDLLAPGAIRLALQQRDQLAQRLGAVADQVELHRVADPEHLAVDVDLHAAGLALLGQELRVGKARADHQQGVAAHHHVPARLGAQQPDRSRHPRLVVGHHGFAQQCLGHAAAEQLGDLGHLRRRRAGRPGPTSIATFSPALRMSAAACRSACRGTLRPRRKPGPECTVPWVRGGSGTASAF